jgi:hypothetical protein
MSITKHEKLEGMFALLENPAKVKPEQGPFASKTDAAQAALATATEKYEKYVSSNVFENIRAQLAYHGVKKDTRFTFRT